MRLALGIEYDGTNYFGWQRQDSKDIVTVQQKLEDALGSVADGVVNVTCAGRTDAGVHAFCQVVHCDVEVSRPDRSWILGTNTNLPGDIRVLWVKHVSPDFHARYDAVARHYRYMIYNNSVASALLRHRSLWFPHSLDERLMQEGAQHLLGEHDFSSFRGSGCQSKSVYRNVELLKISRSGGMINVDIKANAFLLHMVRNIVGVLLKVGCGEKEPSWVKEVLEARDRRSAAVTAAPQGLYLVQVDYKNDPF